MDQQLNTRRIALYVLIGSLIISGLIGIFALAAGDFGQLQVKILLTSLSVSCGSILALACGAAIERGRFLVPSRFGFAIAWIATLLVLVGIWSEMNADEYWRATMTATVVATALALLALLELADLPRRFAAVPTANRVTAAVLTGIILTLIWFDPPENLFLRLMGIASIIMTVLSIVTPVLHYIGRNEAGEREAGPVRPAGTRTAEFLPPVLNLSEKLTAIHDYWRPHVVASLNGQEVRLAKLKGAFDWHHHESEDELFLILDGELALHFRSGVVTLRKGQAIVVPRGIEHRPVADQEVHVLLFEPASTVNTGNVSSERTIRDLPHL